MELRHLDTLLAIDEAGSFTSAADLLATVQSNVSGQVRQLEAELGAELFVRGRRGAVPTEGGEVVIAGARRIRREIESMRADLSMLLGLEAGEASLGIVGTASRWLVPPLVNALRTDAPGVQLHIAEGASERLANDVAERELAMAVVTEPIVDSRLVVEHLLDEALVGVVHTEADVGQGPISLGDLAGIEGGTMILPPAVNPLRAEVAAAARSSDVELTVPIEVEGVRLIADLVASGAGVSVLPETAVPTELANLRMVTLTDVPPRRLALVTARFAHLSLADRAVRETVESLVSSRAGRSHPG